MKLIRSSVAAGRRSKSLFSNARPAASMSCETSVASAGVISPAATAAIIADITDAGSPVELTAGSSNDSALPTCNGRIRSKQSRIATRSPSSAFSTTLLVTPRPDHPATLRARPSFCFSNRGAGQGFPFRTVAREAVPVFRALGARCLPRQIPLGLRARRPLLPTSAHTPRLQWSLLGSRLNPQPEPWRKRVGAKSRILKSLDG